MKMNNSTLAILVVAAIIVIASANVSQIQAAPAAVSGSRVRDGFNYPAGPLNGQIGADERNVFGGFGGETGIPLSTWVSTGDTTTPGDAFIVREENLVFGPQETLFTTPVLGSIGRNPQIGIGGATRLIGKESTDGTPGQGDGTQNTSIQGNITNNFKESFTQLKMVWNGGKVAFALASQEFDLEGLNPKLLVDGNNKSGWGFTIDPDAGDPTNVGILKATAFQSFAASAGNTVDAGAGIQLNKGETYHVFVQGEVSNDATFMDHISAFVLSESDVAAPETTVYLADLPATSKSAVVADFNNFNMKNDLQFAMFATQNFEVDDLAIGFLNSTNLANLGVDADRDPARQALVAFRTVNQKIAWKSSLGDPYVPGDTRLDGVLLGSATNSNVSDNDINHLYEQINLSNPSTVSYYDLDSSGVIDADDVVFLVETLFGTTMGDVDLDGTKDATDQAIVAGNIGGSETTWSDGDINGDNSVDGLDLAFFITLPGDFNGDSVVDAADYTVWLDNLGATEDGSVLNGKGSGGIVDQDDYIVWKSTFGTTTLPGSSIGTAIPEPASVVLMLLISFASFATVRPCRIA